MNTYLAYTRVSSAKQTDGASLFEQRRVISEYARKHSLRISAWHEEVQTAAASGRHTFGEVLAELRRRPGSGLILHKLDRGARNLRDWATLGELIDAGVDIRFAGENLDVGTRGGRLAADIQAVIAADYIRNLREEVRKGMYGRLHQGLYPQRAPLGYQDRGRGLAKVPDPVTASLVLYAFTAFATGRYTLTALAEDLHVRGLSSGSGKPLSPSTMSALLRRTFYVGQCRMKGVTAPGVHQPIVTRELFDQVQRELGRRRQGPRRRRSFRYSRQLECATCHRSLIGERQKGRTYYRCHQCPRISLREDAVDRAAGYAESLLLGGMVRLRQAVSLCTPEYSKFDSLSGA